MDREHFGQKVPARRGLRRRHQGWTGAVSSDEQDLPRSDFQDQYHWRTIQNDGEHQRVSLLYKQLIADFYLVTFLENSN